MFSREYHINTRTRLARLRLVRRNLWLIRRPTKCESGWAVSTTGLCKTQNAVQFRTRRSIAVPCIAEMLVSLEIYSWSYAQLNRIEFIRKTIWECFWYWCVGFVRQSLIFRQISYLDSHVWPTKHMFLWKAFSYEWAYRNNAVFKTISMSNLFAAQRKTNVSKRCRRIVDTVSISKKIMISERFEDYDKSTQVLIYEK